MEHTWAEYNESRRQIQQGSAEEKEQLDRLEMNINKTKNEFVKQAERHLETTSDVASVQTIMDKMNVVYCRQVFSACNDALFKGVSASAVVKTAGMWVCSNLMSENVREHAGELVARLLYPVVRKKVENADPASILRARAEKLTDLPAGQYLYTSEAVGALRTGLCRKTYFRMREDGADVRNIWSGYESVDLTIVSIGKKAGISSSVSDKYMRIAAGVWLHEHPEDQVVFRETAYEDTVRPEMTEKTYKTTLSSGETRTYTRSRWEGRYIEDNGNAFEDHFIPRIPETVNRLRKRSKECWDKYMDQASTPEEWCDVVMNPNTRNAQRKYRMMMMEDDHLSVDDLAHLNDFMDADDDITWLVDIGGPDPFGTGGIEMNYQQFMENGPEPDSNVPYLNGYPEFQSAYRLWLNLHPEVSPYHYQRKANQLYQVYAAGDKQDHEIEKQIFDILQKRDDLQDRWLAVWEKVKEGSLKIVNSHPEEKHRDLPGGGMFAE